MRRLATAFCPPTHVASDRRRTSTPGPAQSTTWAEGTPGIEPGRDARVAEVVRARRLQEVDAGKVLLTRRVEPRVDARPGPRSAVDRESDPPDWG